MAIVEVKRKNGISYKVVWYEKDGSQSSKTFRTKREANAYEKQKKAEIALGLNEMETDITFGKYSEQFAEVHLEGLKKTTQQNYLIIIRQLNKTFEKTKITSMTPMTLDKYFLELRKVRKLKMNTLRKYRDMLKLILGDAYKKDVIASNPIDKLAFKFKVDDQDTDKLLTVQEVNEAVESFQAPYYKFFIKLGLMTGMRKGEMLALRWANVDFDKMEILVIENYNRFDEVTDTKSSKSRIVIIHEALYYLLEEIKFHQKEMKQFFGDEYHDNDLVICKQNGEYLNTDTVSKAFYKKKTSNEINVTPHKLRHTFATLMMDANPEDVQRLLGHANIEMTENYQHGQRSYSDETKEKMNDIFKGF